MTPLRIGLNLLSLKQPVRRALQTAAQLGVKGVEIDAREQIRPEELTGTALRQFRKLLEDLNLQVSSVSFLTRRGYNVEDELDRRIEATKAAMKMAYDLRAKVVVNRIGRVPDSEDSPQWQLMVEALTDLARYGDRVGASLAARTGSEEGTTLMKLLATVPDGTIGVDFDPASLIVGGFSPLEAISALAGRVLNVRAKDAARDLAAGRGIETALGRGTSDFPLLLATLAERDYQGWITIERMHSAQPEREIGYAVQFLRNSIAG